MANNLPNFGDRSIDNFKSALVGGGARANLFEVELAFPAASGYAPSEVDRFLVKAAQLPASNVGVIDIPFRGRNLKVAGDRTFDPWTITVINDTDFHLRNAFEIWMNKINKLDDNAGIITPAYYQADMKVFQLGRGRPASSSTSNNAQTVNSGITTGPMPVLKSYIFKGCFPTAVSAIDLSYDSSDTIEEFTVDLQVQWYDSFVYGSDNSGASIMNYWF